MLNARLGAGASGVGTRSRLVSAASAAAIAWSLFSVLAVGARAQESDVLLERIEITPATPGPRTLCRLTVRVRNAGDRDVYGFGFDVELNGQALRVYENQLFLQVIEAGESDGVALYSFWTSETGRPVPADGDLEVRVRLREARWVRVSEVKEDGETVEVWTPDGAVSGLPQVVSRTLKLK